MHYFGYRRVKYLDDGRDYVSSKEFIAIHVTFSVLNSWMTYFVIFNFFQFVKIWQDDTNNEFWLTSYNLEYVSVIALIIMMFETTVYLAYYKDIIFATITLINYTGMYAHNYDDAQYIINDQS